jgi:hypothetical protein
MDELQVGARPTAMELARPLLFLQMEMTGHGELGEELGRRDVLRRPAESRRGLALGHAHAVVHDGGGVDLHGHGVGVGDVDAAEVEHFLEIEEPSTKVSRASRSRAATARLSSLAAAFTFGLYWSSIYEHLAWPRSRALPATPARAVANEDRG